MRIVCWQTILMKYHSLFLSKIRRDVAKFVSAAVVIGALRVKLECYNSFLASGDFCHLLIA